MVDRHFDFPRPFATNRGSNALPKARPAFADNEPPPTLVPKAKSKPKQSHASKSQRQTGEIIAFNEEADFEKLNKLANMDLDELLAEEPAPIEPSAKFLHAGQEEDDLEAKMEILVEKLKEYKERIKELRTKNLDTAKESYERSQEVEYLNYEIGVLKEELKNSEAAQDQLRVAQHAIIHKKDRGRDDERRRGEITRELLLGANFVEGDFDITAKAERDRNCCEKFLVCILRFFSFFVLLRGQLHKISLSYDKSIVTYFSFYKFLVNASLLVALAFAYLLVIHLLTSSISSTCVYSLPCWLLYSSFDSDDQAFVYSMSLVGLVLLSIIGGLIRWIRADLATKQATFYAGKFTKEFATALFNHWNWSQRTPKDASSAVASTAHLLKAAISERVRATAAAERNRKEKAAIKSKRCIAFLGYLALLCLGMGLVGAIILNEHTFYSFMGSGTRATQLLIFLVPKVGVSIVNAFVPAFSGLLSGIDDWDSPSFEVKVRLVRVYMSKLLNLVVFVAFQLDLAWNTSWFGVSIEFLSDFSCREDQAGVNLACLVFAETLMAKLIPLFVAGLSKLFTCANDKQWRREINVSEQVIDAIYFQLLLWATFAFFPFIAFAGPLFLLFDFLFQSWRLRKLQVKPQHQDRASDLNIFIMRIYNFTLIVAIAYYTAFMLYDRTSSCGCITSTGRDAAIGNVDQVTGFSQVWIYILDSAQFFWILCFLLLGKYVFTLNHAKVNAGFIKERDEDYDIQLRNLNRTISSLNRQVALNKKIISK